MNTAHRTPRALTGLAVLTASLLAACASYPPNQNLEAARLGFTHAAADPNVVRAAPNELERAKQELKRADDAYADKQKPEVVNHYAYLAQQRVQAAVASGQAASADQATADARAQRDGLVLASRTAQANQAAAQAQQAQAAAAAANQRADDLASQLAAAKQTDRGMVLTLGDVLFDTGRASLKDGATRTVDEVAGFLQSHPDRKVMIEGYTDSTGSQSTNLDLSQRRADAVRDALMRRNVSFDRIQVRGLGDRYPVASNDTSSGRQQNRRVEVVFSTPAGQFQSPRT